MLIGSSILKSMKSGHEDLHKIISDLDHLKYTHESFTNAQNTTWENMSKWACKEKNSAMTDTFQHLFQLNCLWSEVQREYIESIKKLKMQFKKILQSELDLDKSKAHLKHLQQKESEFVRKASQCPQEAAAEKIQILANQVQTSHTEVNRKVVENENTKVIATKDGLDEISQSYIQMVDKNSIIARAQYDIVKILPNFRNQELQNVRFPGSAEIRNIVHMAKQNIILYKPYFHNTSSPPPPYAVVANQNSSRSSLENSYNSLSPVPGV
ncbi:uncharacterized protein LOC106668898 isoform X2 [Cimex lectularius]|uniref:Uncharacterized protein n=1 Tax=Cimex lectularius TaxID=79782 RepID=A0A8I6TL28_CIMLE|nr:uncharacterized protein LOC106668898 isoform X2 [Cimex lectularius]